MRLKRVKIFGFKTFAEKTEFDVDGDLIAVVGPNGCGKSNLVDAILWGLGEANARNLRAQTGVDVIFNGSPKRKPVGYAEVSLHFDNEDGSLPIPAPEVVIARKLNRNGDSEYSINRQVCRLRDVVELLADSGLGRSGYSIVGQKEIDQALAASPEERRAWIDEAAGVQRYRARKQESLKRLAGARDHLSRVHDILREIETQREPLREEAEVAKRYKSVVTHLREIEVGLLVVEAKKAHDELFAIEERLEKSLALSDQERLHAHNLEERLRENGEKLSSLETEIDSQRASQQGAMTSFERAQGNIKLGEERLRSLDELKSNLKDEVQSSQNRIAELELEVETLKKQSAEEEHTLVVWAENADRSGQTTKAIADELLSVERELQEARRQHEHNLKLSAESEARAQRLKQIDREMAGIEGSLPDLKKAVEEAASALQQLEARRHEGEAAVHSKSESVRELQAKTEHIARERREHQQRLASLEGRKRAIESTIEMHEGVAQGARFVMEAAERGDLSGSYVLVGEALETCKTHALAIETALGGAVNDLIVEREADAKAAVNLLKERRAGRATFQPIPLMRPVHQSPELRRLLSDPRVAGVASELVDCDALYRPVIDSLLGRVVVVQSLDDALALAKTQGWSRLVTLGGEVVHASGSVTGGQSQKSTYGLVQRKADLEDIEVELEAIAAALGSSEKQSLSIDNQIEVTRSEMQAIRESMRTQAEELDEARKWHHSVVGELNSAEREQSRLNSEREKLTEMTPQVAVAIDIDGFEAKRDDLQKKLAARTADAEVAAVRLQEAKLRREQAHERMASAEKRLQQAREMDQLRLRKQENLEPETERIRAEIQNATEEMRRLEVRLSELDVVIRQLSANKQGLLEENFKLSDQAKHARENASAAAEAAHAAELGRARADSRRANSLQRLLEEYSINEEDAYNMAEGTLVPDDAPGLVAKLRREIRAMGDVNVGAIEAYERLTERAEELNVQVEDIESGIAEVEASIRELDGLTRARFEETFEQVRVTFTRMFHRLFGGGEANLALHDPENILDSGIDIHVTVPNKNRQRLELLSGGERSLCATAFLFSLLYVKPTPLVILDEVDAPLDGRNVERYIDILRDFASGKVYEIPNGEATDLPERIHAPIRSQFIVITHNPTTIEAAPVWLGVTMQEPGVSSLVPVRMDEKREQVTVV